MKLRNNSINTPLDCIECPLKGTLIRGIYKNCFLEGPETSGLGVL